MQLLSFVHLVFLLIILIRIAAFGRRAHVILREGFLKDVRLFFHEYWKWGHVQSNLIGFALGISSFLAYGYVLFLGGRVRDISLNVAFETQPVAFVVLILGMAGLTGYTIYRSIEQHKTTLDICAGLRALRNFRFYKNSIEALQSAEWMQKGAGAFVHLGLSGVKWFSTEVMNHITAEKVRGAIGGFLIAAVVEYSLRLLLIGLTLFILEGRITLWV
ncbi:MAG: hypothetical protein JNM27_09360 [Leptospirales bacterium]|nr:hypothetical protein [Leptospirales bacterium]